NGRLESQVRNTAPPSLYSYDAVSRPLAIAHDLAGTAYDLTLGFTYNAAGQIATRSKSNDAYAWADPNSYVRSYAANGLNQYSGTTSTGAPPAAYAYDSNGNLASDGSTSFVYDVENRLVSASGAKTAALVYDPLGRLFQVSGGATPLQFLYDGDALIGEFDGPQSRPRLFVHAVGADVPFIWFEGASRPGVLRGC
ncbi:MAG TPA: hypothetical protein VF645_04390, partial [Allosphingosinicella sp.]